MCVVLNAQKKHRVNTCLPSEVTFNHDVCDNHRPHVSGFICLGETKRAIFIPHFLVAQIRESIRFDYVRKTNLTDLLMNQTDLVFEFLL